MVYTPRDADAQHSGILGDAIKKVASGGDGNANPAPQQVDRLPTTHGIMAGDLRSPTYRPDVTADPFGDGFTPNAGDFNFG